MNFLLTKLSFRVAMLIRSLTRQLRHAVALGRGLSSAVSEQNAPEVVFDASRPDGVALVGLNRPAAKNAMSMNLLKCIEETVDALAESNTVRCVILHSLVPKIFCAGADLKERKGMEESDIGTFVAGARKLVQVRLRVVEMRLDMMIAETLPL